MSSIRLHLFWLQRIFGNTFTPACVFGRYWKLGQTELVFCVDCKIRHFGHKTISSFILPLNDFHPRKIEERERERERDTHTHTQQGDRTKSTSLVASSTGPNPKSHQSRHTPALTRSRRLKHQRDCNPASARSQP